MLKQSDREDSQAEAADLVIAQMPGIPNGASSAPRQPNRPKTPAAMLRQLSAFSVGFANGSVAISKALVARRQVVIAANMSHDAVSLPALSCWHCTHDQHGIELRPFAIGALWSPKLHAEPWVDQLIGNGTKGDALVVCDPWGDNELLCWALRVASQREIETIAITTDQPNLLAAFVHHSIRVPVTPPFDREFAITALHHLVDTAGVAVIPAHRRALGPLRALSFD